MKATARIAVILTTGCALMFMMPICTASADSFEDLGVEWWQWALSIPTSVNPQVDTTGEHAAVGQRGKVWFLAGVFAGTEALKRKCSVPEGTALFFPVFNSVQINAPNVCGQGPADLSVEDMRATAAAEVDKATDVSVKIDGAAIKNVRRIKSKLFAVALPEDNVFDLLCSVPGGIYSPAVYDGFYVLLDKLPAGDHRLQFQAKDSSGTLLQNVMYALRVVPVSTK